MSTRGSVPRVDTTDDIAALIETLIETGQRLEELTAGQVDAVADRNGKMFLLRHTQEQLRVVEATKQAAILNALPANIALLDSQGLIVSVNEAWRQFGDAIAAHAPGHEVGVNYLAICDSETGQDTAEARQAGAGIRSVLSRQVKHFALEYPCHSPTQQRWFVLTVAPLSEEQLNGAVVMHIDVTAERQSQENLQVSETRFRQMADNITDVFWVTSPDSKITHYISPGYQLIWGRSMESLYANPQQWMENILPEDRDRVATLFAALAGSEPKVSAEYRIARPDGSVRWVHDRGFQVRDDTGNLVRLTGIVSDITERKLVQEALQRQQTELRVLFDLMPAMIWFKDTQNRILRINQRAAEAAGKTVLEIEGRPSLDIYPHNEAKSFADDLEVIQSGFPKLGIIETLPGPNGETLWVQTDKVPYRDQDGNVIGIVVMAQDITERKRVEAEATRLLSVLEVSLNEIYIFDAVTLRFDYVNDCARRNLGYTMIEISQQTPLFFKREFTLASFEELIGPLRRHEQPKIIFTTTHQRSDGSLYAVEVHLQLVEHTGKAVFLAVINDITARQHAAQELRESERRFNDMLQNVNLISVMLDPEARITFCNEYLLHLTGWRHEDVIGQDWFRLFIPPEINDLKTDFAKFISSSPEAWHHENEILTRSGERRLIRWNNSVLRSGSGAVLGTASIGEDITEQSRAELRIKRLNRVYAVLSGINTLIVRVRDRDQLFREACRIAVEEGAFKMAWIGAIDPQTLDGKVVAWHGGEAEYIDKVRFTARAEAPDSGRPASCALRQLQVVICNDIATEPSMVLRQELLSRGHKSAGYFPLTVAGRPVAVLALFAGETDVFDDEEMRLLRGLAEDISFALDYIEKQERLTYLAYYDVLTGLANRTLFHERLEQGVMTAQTQGCKLGLVLIDIERFKTINDTFGRPVGDALLKAVAARLSELAVDVGRLGRLDADHFAVMVLEVQSEKELARLVEHRLVEIFSPPFRIGDSDLRLSAKMGIALYPTDGVDADALFRNAEAALKNTKTSGEQYLFYAPAMNARVAEKLALENQLRQALDRGEFVLHYQPKINLVTGKLTSAEALIRWNDPRAGLVAPGQFIPILEETGLINEVGRWALRQAIADYLHWCNAGYTAVRIAVNVSPLQLRHRGFTAEIEQAIGTDKQAAAGLELEITESLIMEDVKHSIESLKAIRALGITIAIDDFGTGFSSLSYLAKLPVDTLKIDASFVIDMTTGPEGLALVSTIINLAHSLKLKVVAEGVETDEQSRLLRLLDCDEMQGFLFSKAVPSEIFEARFLAPPLAG